MKKLLLTALISLVTMGAIASAPVKTPSKEDCTYEITQMSFRNKEPAEGYTYIVNLRQVTHVRPFKGRDYVSVSAGELFIDVKVDNVDRFVAQFKKCNQL